jgi:DNA-binding transcriptional ArsR family regulator
MDQATERVSLVFGALADPWRRQMLSRLAKGPGAIVDLSRDLPFTRQAATKHLNALCRAGLVRVAKRGREQVFELTREPLDDAEAWLQNLDQAWANRLQALAEHLAKNP